MKKSNRSITTNITTLGELAKKLERNSTAFAIRILGGIITSVGLVSLVALQWLGRNASIAFVLVSAGVLTFSIASRAAHRVAIDGNTLTDLMLGAIADSESIPEWAKIQTTAEYMLQGRVVLATMTAIDQRITTEREGLRRVDHSPPGADRLVQRYGTKVDPSSQADRRVE